jgi:hypothetical protein
VLRVDTEPQRQFDGLVELGELDLLCQRYRFFDRIRTVEDDLRVGGGELPSATPS